LGGAESNGVPEGANRFFREFRESCLFPSVNSRQFSLAGLTHTARGDIRATMPEPITESREEETPCCGGALGELWAKAEESARQEPLKTTGLAFFAGVLFAILPIGSLLAALIRVGFSLFRPALLVLGALKVVEEIDRRQNS
jgi:hypothetical protein